MGIVNDLRRAAQEVASDLRQLARDNRERYPDLAPALQAYADILQRAMDADRTADREKP